MPGVVVLDRVMQLAQESVGGSTIGWQVSQAKFLGPCGPGDTLQFALREAARGGLAFTVRCGDRDIASGLLQAPSP
jgi:3-hydroxymyristoyl/3-hydroxydecanoyl-(acyl carrier protein) dehydratase